MIYQECIQKEKNINQRTTKLMKSGCHLNIFVSLLNINPRRRGILIIKNGLDKVIISRHMCAAAQKTVHNGLFCPTVRRDTCMY